MPIERRPANPLPKNFVPKGGVPYKVETGDSWKRVAQRLGIPVWDLIQFNFPTVAKTRNRQQRMAEVNWYLRRNVGCKKATRDNKNWMFTSNAKPGIIYLPKPARATAATVPPTSPRAKIRVYAQQQANLVAKGLVCSCHAMADIWGYAAMMPHYRGFLSNDEESYVEDVSHVLAGVDEWCLNIDPNRVGRTIFTDSGFKKEFQDGSNQVQHFCAGVMAGFQYGHWGGALHRVARPDSPEDTALNDESTAMGAGLDGIGVSLDEVQVKIERFVCEPKCGICNNGKGR